MKTNSFTSQSLSLGVAFFAATLLSVTTAFAAEPVQKQAASAKDIVLVGDAKCTKCHDESDSPMMLAIGKTRHGTNADSRTPSCVSCHGESDKHINKPEGVKAINAQRPEKVKRPFPMGGECEKSTFYTLVPVENDA